MRLMEGVDIGCPSPLVEAKKFCDWNRFIGSNLAGCRWREVGFGVGNLGSECGEVFECVE
jgi:hypothetical protein